jgi:hypothetical protein
MKITLPSDITETLLHGYNLWKHVSIAFSVEQQTFCEEQQTKDKGRGKKRVKKSMKP